MLYLSEFMDTLMCPKTEGDYRRYYALPCILKQCKRCGWGKIQGKCPVEKQLLVGKDKEGGADSGSEEEDGELDENSVVKFDSYEPNTWIWLENRRRYSKSKASR